MPLTKCAKQYTNVYGIGRYWIVLLTIYVLVVFLFGIVYLNMLYYFSKELGLLLVEHLVGAE